MTKALAPNRTASIARARVEDDLVRIAKSWGSDQRGPVYVQALSGWLSSHKSPNTARAYRFALTEFADWYELKRGKSFVPHLVTTTDANLYANYLLTRTEGLEELRLKRAGHLVELAVYRAVRKRPGANIDQIRDAIIGQMGVETAFVEREGRRETVLAMEKGDFYAFDKFLAKMVDHKILARTPSIRWLRENKDKNTGFGTRPDPTLFHYTLAQHSRYAPGERASTLDARLSALSSFWRYMIERGENLPGYEQPVKVNIWAPIKRDYAPKAREQKKLARAATTTEKPTFDRLLSVVEGSRAVADIRDRAALLMFYWTGIRADELGRVKRADVSWPAEAGRAALIRVFGKGAKVRQFRIPPVAFQALVDLSMKLDELAQAEEQRDESILPRSRILLSGDAPLLPPLGRWGANSVRKGDWNEQTLMDDLKVGLSRGAWSMMLQALAERAGISRQSPEFRQIHPHGLRHLAGREAVARGVPLPTVQAAFGHSNIATTGVYAETYDPAAIGLDMAPGAAAAAVAPAPHAAQPTQAAPPPEDEGEQKAPPEGPLWAYASTGAEAREMLVKRSDADRPALATVRIGVRSRLAWWGGPANHLDPALPVIAPPQVLGTWPERDVLVRGLSDLYGSWLLSKGDHGATSAAALVWWLSEALDVTEQVDEALLAEEHRWFPFDASEEDPEYDPRGVRGHDAEFIIDWFRAHGWKYTKTMKTMRVDDAPPPEPAWFADEDPVASLPDDEREQALTWIDALTGRVQAESQEAERELLTETLSELSKLGDIPPAKRSKDEASYRATLAAEAAKVLEKHGVKVGGAEGVLKLDEQRREQTAAARMGTGADAPTRKSFWARLVRRAFPDAGEPVAPVLSDYRDLLSVDHDAGTIVHDPEFRSEFARVVGGHSECVARRIARYLWELRKADLAAREAGEKRPRTAERADELVRDVQAMRYLLAPCSKEQEDELWKRVEGLGTSSRSVDAAFRRHAAIIEQQQDIAQKLKSKARAPIRELEVAAELKQAEREGAAIGGIEPRGAGHLVPNGRTLVRMVPSPIVLLIAVRT